MAIEVTAPFHVGDYAVLRWTYTPESTGEVTADADPTVELYPPNDAAKVTYTTANGIEEETPDHYRLYIPIAAGGTHVGYITGTDATTGMEPFEFWAPPRRTP